MSTRTAVAGASVALLVSCAGTVRAEQTLRLVWFDTTGLAAGADRLARDEAATLVSRMGAVVSWRRGEPGEVRRRDEIWVVLIAEGPRRPASRLVLGTTLRNPRVAPLVWVRVPNVAAALGITGPRGRPGLPVGDLRRLGVAVGRVVAHELVHAVVPAQPHGSGLMSESFSARQPDAATMPIEPEAAQAFRAALIGGPVPLPAGTVVAATLAPEDGSCRCPPASLR